MICLLRTDIVPNPVSNNSLGEELTANIENSLCYFVTKVIVRY